MKARDAVAKVLLIIIPAALVAWIRTLVDKDETFADNFITFIVLAIIIYIGGALITKRTNK